MCLSILLFLAVWSLSFSIKTQSQAASPAANVNRFGIVEGMWYPDLTCDLHPGWERLIFDWAAHQPEDTDSWTGFLNIPDEWLRAATACDREIVAVIKNTPAWATDGTPGIGIPRGLYLPIDDPANIWANFMRMAAAYYTSRGVYRFIIYNEPDIQEGTYGYEFEGTVADYAQMVKVAYLAAKQANPTAMIHLAGTTYWHDANSGRRLYTDQLLELLWNDPEGAENTYYFDVLSLHIYFRTDTVYEIIRRYRDLLDQYGFTDKAIWINETNASPNLDPNWPVVRPQYQISLDQQAAFLVQAAALGLAAGAERIAAYKLYDQLLPAGGESFGLLNPRYPEIPPRPAFYAWQTVINHFSGVERAILAQSDTISIIKLEQANEQQTFVAWSRTAETAQIEINATGDKAYLLDQVANSTIIRPENGVYRLTLPGASCDSDDGCAVGGNVSIFVQMDGETSVNQIENDTRIELVFE